MGMEPNRALEQLQVIRTLMERSAIYRRALKPTMFMLGGVGSLAAAAGWFFDIHSNRSFGLFWMSVSIAAISLAFVMVRRQAFKDGEPFWSPPTRRVAQAAAPPLLVGFLTGLLLIGAMGEAARQGWWLLPVWMSLYGCAMHAAGFFMPRGIKLFGWAFIVSGAFAGMILTFSNDLPALRSAHGIMGLFFGGLHFGYGLYLHFTGRRKNET
jgi:hypothetical protein